MANLSPNGWSRAHMRKNASVVVNSSGGSSCHSSSGTSGAAAIVVVAMIKIIMIIVIIISFTTKKDYPLGSIRNPTGTSDSGLTHPLRKFRGRFPSKSLNIHLTIFHPRLHTSMLHGSMV